MQEPATFTTRITTQRIKLERGLLSKVQESLELFRIDHFELRKPLGSRLLGQAFSASVSHPTRSLRTFQFTACLILRLSQIELRECQLRERDAPQPTTFVKA